MVDETYLLLHKSTNFTSHKTNNFNIKNMIISVLKPCMAALNIERSEGKKARSKSILLQRK